MPTAPRASAVACAHHQWLSLSRRRPTRLYDAGAINVDGSLTPGHGRARVPPPGPGAASVVIRGTGDIEDAEQETPMPYGASQVPEGMATRGPRRAIKRALDITLASCALIALAPFMAAAALAIRVTQGRPVLFRQERPGLEGRPFTILKFRSMSLATGPDGGMLPEAERLTRLGFWMRKTSFDELPELWNVLRGEMSIVGPRPLLMRYLPLAPLPWTLPVPCRWWPPWA